MFIGGPEPSLFRGVCGNVLCVERERTGVSLSLVISDGDWLREKKLTEDTEPSRPLIGGGRGGGGGGFIRVGSSDQLIHCLSRLWVDSEAAGFCRGVSVGNEAGSLGLQHVAVCSVFSGRSWTVENDGDWESLATRARLVVVGIS